MYIQRVLTNRPFHFVATAAWFQRESKWGLHLVYSRAVLWKLEQPTVDHTHHSSRNTFEHNQIDIHCWCKRIRWKQGCMLYLMAPPVYRCALYMYIMLHSSPQGSVGVFSTLKSWETELENTFCGWWSLTPSISWWSIIEPPQSVGLRLSTSETWWKRSVNQLTSLKYYNWTLPRMCKVVWLVKFMPFWLCNMLPTFLAYNFSSYIHVGQCMQFRRL